MATRGGFVGNLGKIYGIYTGGFVGFVILMAILEQLGVPDRAIGYMFIGFTIAIYAIIGIVSRTTDI
ncbi:MAG TPA: cation acetate symporter, partial [Geminicoccaceae bacterium]|nr:cation acetate symporter [Geminicoccaceae bacterium]